GNSITLSIDEQYYNCGTAAKIYVDYKNIVKILKVGDIVFVDDGLISLEVIKIGADFIDTRIKNGGMLGSRKGINLPGAEVDLPTLSDKDKDDIKFGIEQKVDMIFASFIRKGEDILKI
ncbi:pyruvate kinase, partial [Salmonella sp. s51228]|uniref:pyruvate kinase n=1 Tax=Salmonella sp. s51228 TaxID=3159652 RepID=UPI00397F31CD